MHALAGWRLVGGQAKARETAIHGGGGVRQVRPGLQRACAQGGGLGSRRAASGLEEGEVEKRTFPLFLGILTAGANAPVCVVWCFGCVCERGCRRRDGEEEEEGRSRSVRSRRWWRHDECVVVAAADKGRQTAKVGWGGPRFAHSFIAAAGQ